MRTLRLGLIATLVAGILYAGTGPSHAANPGFTSDGNTLSGTAGDDTLILTINEFDLTHNRFAEGDPGFESAADFDPAAEGVQTRQLGMHGLGFAGGQGNDTIKVVGTFQQGLHHDLPNFYGEDGSDTLDFSEMVVQELGGPIRGIKAGSSGEVTTIYSHFERFRGTALNDDITVDAYGANPALTLIETLAGNDRVFGTERGETIDAGSGTNEVEANGGNDTVIVSSPLPSADKHLWGGSGTDILKVTGTAGADDVALFSRVPYTYVGDPDSEFAYQTMEFESMQFDLGNGDDNLYIEPVILPTALQGGAGNDAVLMNALRYPASIVNQTFVVGGMPGLQTSGFEEREIFNTLFIAAGVGPGGAPTSEPSTRRPRTKRASTPTAKASLAA